MARRPCRSGDAFETEQKLIKRYEAEEKLGTPGRIIDWFNRIIKGELPPCNPKDWKDTVNYLKDGVALCKVMNKLLAHAGMSKIRYRMKADTAFVAMNNIDVFNKAAMEYGVPQTSLFQTSDLWDGRKGALLNVINTLNALGFVANARGFDPEYLAIEPPKADWALDSE